MAYRDLKNLNRKTAADKVLRDKIFNIAKNPKYDRYQHGFAAMFHEYFDEKTSGRTVRNEMTSNKELAEELHKPIIRKFEKTKVHSPFIGNIWGANVADMQLRRTFNKGFRSLSSVIDIHGYFA